MVHLSQSRIRSVTERQALFFLDRAKKHGSAWRVPGYALLLVLVLALLYIDYLLPIDSFRQLITKPQRLLGVLATLILLLVAGAGARSALGIFSRESPFRRSFWPILFVLLLFSALDALAFQWVCLPTVFEAIGLNEIPSFDYASPNILVPVLVGMVYGGPAALVAGLFTGVALGVRDLSLGAFLVTFCASTVAARFAPNANQPQRYLLVFLRAAFWQSVIVAALIVLRTLGAEGIAANLIPCLWQAGANVLSIWIWNALSAALLIYPILPFWERSSGSISNYSLGRYTNLERPLLRQLAREAPGTYRHAMLVADFAQAAAEVIGANGLLCRVGAYYHDIGKLSHPGYFTENQANGENPHDNLPPNVSRMIIQSHVKDGLIIANMPEYHLPNVVQRFIACHHGTTPARYFLYQQRLVNKEAGLPDAGVDAHFRYPGPKPATKEETIVSLADSIEAASNSLRHPTEKSILDLADSIIRSNLLDGQLTDSALTHAELDAIRQSFIASMSHNLHNRVAYPGQRAKKAKAPPKDNAPSPR